MATYNGEKYLKEQIDSILDQSIQNFELVICDDCSKDSTWSILEEYAQRDSRIRIYENEKNLGVKHNFEKAISLTRGQLSYKVGYLSGKLLWDEEGFPVLPFGHKSETPGLGGEITTEKFQDQFAGKQIMNNGNVIPIEFDAITGATKTSNGVKEMIDNTLEKYSAYLSRIAERGE